MKARGFSELFRQSFGGLVFFLMMAWPGLGAMEAQDSWMFGLVGALSGPKSPYGISQKQGAELAIAEINRAGGVQGRPLQLLAHDDKGTPGEVGSIAVSLAGNEKILGILGSTDSGCTHVLSMVAVKTHTPHITCVATDPSLTRAGTPWTFRTLADDIAQAGALVQWLKNEKPQGPVAVMAAPSRYGKIGSQTVVRLARAAGLAVTGPRVMSVESLSDSIRELLQEKPNVVILWALANDGLAAVRELRKQGFSGRIAGGDGLASPAFFAQKTVSVEGVVVTCPYDLQEDSPANRKFREVFRRTFSVEPDSFSAHSYDTMNLLAQALKNSDGTRSGLRVALASGTGYIGVTGVLRFDASGNDRRPVRLAVCREGALTVLPELP